MPRTMISEMQLNETYNVPLVVTEATERSTKRGKPYLDMTLYDGIDKINCKYWDWNGQTMPKVNTVYDFKVTCGEYMGKKQLTCNKVTLNTTHMLEDFMPQGQADVSQAYKDFYSLICDIKDDFLRNVGLKVAEAAKDLWLHVPGANSIHHAYMGGTLVHSLSVGRLSYNMAKGIDGAWPDLALLGGLLHDTGKLFTYQLEGVTINMTDDGRLLEHPFIGAEFVGNLCSDLVHTEFDELKLQMLRHIILSHHLRLEYGSPVTPRCIEAFIVAHCDDVDAKAEMIREASRKAGSTSRWTERLWAADNNECFTTQAIEALSKKPYITGEELQTHIANVFDDYANE